MAHDLHGRGPPLQRVVGGCPLQHIGQGRVAEVLAPQRLLGQDRRAQQLADVHPRDPDLGQAAGAAGVRSEGPHPSQRDPQRAHVAQAQRQPVPAGVHGEGAAGDLNMRHLHERVGLVGQQVDIRDVAGRVEGDLDPEATGIQRGVGLPRGVRVPVERRIRAVLRELGQLRVVGRLHVTHAGELRHGLGVGPPVGEWVHQRGVGAERVGRRLRGTDVRIDPAGDEHPPAVGVGDEHIAAGQRLAADGGGGLVAGVEQRLGAGQPAQSGDVGDALGRAVDDRRRSAGFNPHQSARRRVVDPHLRQPLGRVGGLRRGDERLHRPVAVGGAAQTRLGGQLLRGRVGSERAAERVVVIGGCNHRPGAHQIQQRSQFSGQQPLLLHEVVDRPQEVGGVQVVERRHVADRDGTLGGGDQDRIDRAAPVVVRVGLPGEDQRAAVGRQPRVEVLAGVGPGRRYGRVRQFQRPALEQGQRAQYHQGRRHHQRRGPGEAVEQTPQRRRRATGQQRHRQCQQRPGLVGGAQELDGADVVVDERSAAARQGPARKADGHHQQRHQHQGQQKRAVAPAARPHVAAERQCRHQQRRGDHPRVEQQRGGVLVIRDQPAAEPDAEVRRPVPHQPQALRQAGGGPDRADLLGELQEVQPVPRLDEQRHHPPGRRDRRGERRAPGHRPRRRPGGVSQPHLVEHQQHRPEQHQRGHGRVNAAAAGGRHQRERRRPPPPPGLPQAAMGDHHQPRQRRVGQQEHGHAAGEDHDIRVDHVDEPGDNVRGAAPAAQQRVDQPDHAPGGQRQQPAQPQPLGHPIGQAQDVPEREERVHRPQVAGVLAALDVPQPLGRAPHRHQVGQVAQRVDVQVDLGVGRVLAGPLGERQREPGQRQSQGDPPAPAVCSRAPRRGVACDRRAHRGVRRSWPCGSACAGRRRRAPPCAGARRVASPRRTRRRAGTPAPDRATARVWGPAGPARRRWTCACW